MASLLARAHHRLRNWRLDKRLKRDVVKWEATGRPNPPPHLVKQQVLRELAREFGLEILVETGTFRGDMVEAMRRDFRRVYSIELSQELFAAAQQRFADCPNVQILQGDSGQVLADLMPQLDAPTLFWLDGHYSAGNTARGAKDTPVFEELGHIFHTPPTDCVIVIDDARLFGTDPSYPTLSELRQFVSSHRPGMSITMATDSIRILPAPA